MANQVIYTVTQINNQIKQLLESNFTSFWLEGELSNFKHHSSGHMYFSLKDDRSELRAVMWRGVNQSLLFRPENGMQVLAYGGISVYTPRGQYQLVVEQLQPAGVGALQVAFEQLKERLHAEGLFDESRKRTLPSYPMTVGVVTSATGAAFHDICQVLSRRAPYVHVILAPARVQGEGASPEIVDGIRRLNRLGGVDVIIVGRGGGSLEDLWAFNEEAVARAIVDSQLPVVSAVGHEVDYTISDFCADVRAPTPSAAAEIVARDSGELRSEIQGIQEYLANRLVEKVARLRSRIESLSTHYVFKLPQQRLATLSQRVDELTTTLERITVQSLRNRYQQLTHLEQQLNLLHPDHILRRGYSITSTPDGTGIRSAEEVQPADILKTRFYRGSVMSRVTGIGGENASEKE